MDDAFRVEIERYLAGGMSPEETEAFLRRVQADPEALAWLGRGLEDQAHLFDAARALPRRAPRARRFRAWLSTETRAPIGLIAAVGAAAILLVVGIALSAKPRRLEPPAAEPVAAQPDRPEPPEPPAAPRVRPEAPRTPAPKPEEPVVPTPPPPVPAPAPVPLPEPPKPAKPEEPPAPRETKIATPAIGTIEKIVGDVSAPAGPILAGQSLRTGRKSSALLRLRRATVEVGEGTSVEDLSDGRTRFRLVEGSVLVDVAPSAQDPLVLATRQSEVTVLGTKFRLSVSADATRLEVTQGRVRMQRLSDKAAVEVRAGHFAVAGPGEMAAKPLPIDEIVVLPVHGAIGGGDWRVVPDPDASTGRALEAPKVGRWAKPNTTGDTSRVTFTFRADADRDYHIWVRGRTTATEKHIERDAVILEFAGAAVTERPGTNKGVAGGSERALFNGYMHESGYWWIGGDADGKNDEIPVVVRFARPGVQTLRMFAFETPVRIDAIWISATQKSRPEPSHPGPK